MSVKNGTWLAEVERKHKRVISLQAINSAHYNDKNQYEWESFPELAFVDSGQAGIFDAATKNIAPANTWHML